MHVTPLRPKKPAAIKQPTKTSMPQLARLDRKFDSKASLDIVPSIMSIGLPTHARRPVRMQLRGSISEINTLRKSSNAGKPNMVDQSTSTQ